jgi:hypothetical protein
MRELVAFPDSERAVIQYLTPALNAYDATIPIDVRGAGKRFVRVRRVGGTEGDVAHDNPTVDVIVWHETDYERMRLALHLWSVLRACAGDATADAVLHYRDTFLGPRQIPDPADDTKSVCMFTVTLIVRSRLTPE